MKDGASIPLAAACPADQPPNSDRDARRLLFPQGRGAGELPPGAAVMREAKIETARELFNVRHEPSEIMRILTRELEAAYRAGWLDAQRNKQASHVREDEFHDFVKRDHADD